MKILTLTCHNVYNCGASLQAYALQQYLLKQGYETAVIDYRPDYFDYKYKWSWYINWRSPYYQRCLNSKWFRIIYVTQRYLSSLRSTGRKKVFDSFLQKELYLTSKYDNYLQLAQNPPQADMYIVGSDQVWNFSNLNVGWDPAFYLAFGDKDVRRISYAASFGSASVKYPFLVSKYLRILDSISIREKSSLKIIKSAGLNAKVVCDPVFLLSKEDWQTLIKTDKISKPYVLIYNLGDINKDLIQHANFLAKERGLEIHVIQTSNVKISADRVLKHVGPREFLNEIGNASCVLSNSFHATAFSLIFNKEFYTYTFNKIESSQRMIDLLEKLKLQHHFNPAVINKSQMQENLQTEDYFAMINESKLWLSEEIKAAAII